MSKQGHSQEQIDRKLKSIDSWKDTIVRYKKKLTTYKTERSKKLLRNNIQIAEHQVRIVESQLMVDKFRKRELQDKIKYVITLITEGKPLFIAGVFLFVLRLIILHTLQAGNPSMM